MSYDVVQAPKHYAGDGTIACKDAMRSMLAGYEQVRRQKPEVIYWAACAFKYIWRF